MAARCTDRGDIKKQDIEDITTCCICTEVYTDPKALPCIHTFCMKCIQECGLKTNKGPGDEMPCPICRQPFKIPEQGFHRLPKNFFIEKLIQVVNVSDKTSSPRATCDACLEESRNELGKEISTADTYCVDCNQKFCEDCCRQHKKFKLTKNHKLITLHEYKSGRSLSTYQAQSVCEVHEQKVMDVYCADCKTVVCAICFIEEHNNHTGSHADKFASDFRKQIESHVERVNECRSKAQKKQKEFLEVKDDIEKRVERLECDVANRKDELKQIIDNHAASLLQHMYTMKQSKLKEIQMATDDVDTYLSSLDTFNSYCQKIMDIGSASDICRAYSDLSARALDLQEQCQPNIERKLQCLLLFFTKLELEDFLGENCDNLIGEIEEEGVWKLRKRSRQHLLRKQNVRKKTVFLEDKLKQEQIEADQLKIKQTEERLGRQAEFRYKSEPVLVQTIRTKASEEEKKGICGLTILDKELFVVSWKSSDVEVYDSIELSFSRRWKLKELIQPQDIASCDRNKCIYIIDSKVTGQAKEILRVNPNEKLINYWSTGDVYGLGLSVTDDSTVIVAVYKRNKLSEYSPDGQLIREIKLSSDIRSPWHAVKLTNGHFLVSHGYLGDFLNRVCVVNEDGNLINSFGGQRGSAIGQTNLPVHMSVDANEFVMVADRENSRVLLLDSDLKFKREILCKGKHGLRRPQRILLDESNCRLLVADNDLTYDGRILIFEL